MQFKDALSKAMHIHLSAPNTKPKYFAHYTKQNSLISILKEKQFRFSHWKHVNDPSEYKFGEDKLIDIIYNDNFNHKINKNLNYPLEFNLNKSIKYNHENFNAIFRRDFLSISLCASNNVEHFQNDFHMWDNYAGSNGACIVFNGKFINERMIILTDSDYEFIHFGPVNYGEHPIEQKLISGISSIIEDERNFLPYTLWNLGFIDGPNPTITRIRNLTLWYTHMLPFYFKNESFAKEAEWRISYYQGAADTTNQCGSNKKFGIKNIKKTNQHNYLDLSHLDWHELIHCILVHPRYDPEILRKSLNDHELRYAADRILTANQMQE